MNPVMNCSFDVNAPEKLRSAALEEAALQSQIDLARELESVRSELQQTRNEFSDYKAQQDEYHRAEAAQTEIDKKKQRRHEFKLSAFTVCFTLFLEHIPDLINLFQISVKFVISLFH